MFDALKGRPRERFLETVKRLERTNQELAVLEHDAVEIMKMRRNGASFPPCRRASTDSRLQATTRRTESCSAASRSGRQAAPDDAPAADPVEQPLERVDELTSAVREAAIALQRQKLSRWFEGGRPFGMFVFDVGDRRRAQRHAAGLARLAMDRGELR